MIKLWIKLAARAVSIEAFIESTGLMLNKQE
jgi:hypothetical protein